MPLPEDEQGFEDRRDAGRRLAAKLIKYAGEPDLLVLALPRGGVPVPYEDRGERSRPKVKGRIVILVDDGLATGASMRAAVQALNEEHPKRLVVGVPVAPPETCAAIRAEVDEIVCALTPPAFYGVGRWYEDFMQTTDDEVRELLGRSNRRAQLQPQSPAPL